MIKFYNRKTRKYEIEQVAGNTYLKWTYSSPVGMKLLELVVKKKFFSKIYGSFCDSKREWSIFHSDNFGEVLCIEVGATFVGSIIQTYAPGKRVKRGEEKGYFKFGGSTIMLFFQKDKVKIDADILDQTNKGYETSVVLGEKIGEGAVR